MKWADAKTRLSFVTAILNSLRAAMVGAGVGGPPALEQHDQDRRRGEVGRGPGIPGMAGGGPPPAPPGGGARAGPPARPRPRGPPPRPPPPARPRRRAPRPAR